MAIDQQRLIFLFLINARHKKCIMKFDFTFAFKSTNPFICKLSAIPFHTNETTLMHIDWWCFEEAHRLGKISEKFNFDCRD